MNLGLEPSTAALLVIFLLFGGATGLLLSRAWGRISVFMSHKAMEIASELYELDTLYHELTLVRKALVEKGLRAAEERRILLEAAQKDAKGLIQERKAYMERELKQNELIFQQALQARGTDFAEEVRKKVLARALELVLQRAKPRAVSLEEVEALETLLAGLSSARS